MGNLEKIIVPQEGQEDLGRYLAALDHPDAGERKSAAAVLHRYPEIQVVHALRKSIHVEQDSRVLHALWRALGRILGRMGRVEDLGMILECVRDPQFDEDCMGDFARAALQILSRHPGRLPNALENIMEACSEPLVETALKKAISSLTGQRFARGLSRAYLVLLQQERFAAFHPAMIEALGHMREQSAIGTLLENFEKVPRLRDCVLGALSLIGAEHLDEVMALAVRLHDQVYYRTPAEQEFPCFFFESAQELARRGGAAVPVLVKLLLHSNGVMRQNARFALERMEDASSLELLLKMAEETGAPSVLRVAWEVVLKNHPNLSMRGLARERLEEVQPI